MASVGIDLELELPATLPVGAASAVLCLGSFRASSPVERLELLVDGVRHGRAAVRRGVFWEIVAIAARDHAGVVDVRAAVRLEDGSESIVPLGRIEVVEPAPPTSSAGASAPPGLIAVCMATFDPDIALFRRQVESLRAQTDQRWTCLISDDCSAPERYREILAAVEGDPRFTVSRSERRLGFYRNFERALQLAPAEADLIALSDQDDRWDRDKLEVLRSALGSAGLVCSDLRLADADGRVLRDTLWRRRHANHTNLASQLVANTMAGAAMLFRRELLALALPFPEVPGVPFHDHWLGLVALAAGDVAYVNRSLYDYVQHRGAVFGDVAGGARAPGGGIARWRAAYFYGCLPREVQARTLLLRCADRLTPAKRRALKWFAAVPRSPAAFVWLVARPLRALLGRNETLGSELDLARGIVWRWLAGLRRGGDAGLPPVSAFEQRRLRRWRARL